MSDIAVVAGGRAAWRDGPDTAPDTGPDARRLLQLAPAGLWLLDAQLQYQPMMSSRAFGQTLAATADGNPGFIARPITWDATLTQQHAAALNVVFATIQLRLGLGIAWVVLAAAFTLVAAGVYLPRPAAVTALVLAIVIAAVIWMIGEAFGMILAGGATDPNSGPLLALLALACWPARTAPGEGGRS